ncbi:Replicase polyprotein 1a [Frankliniella fusca]|uniref:Replicase polyprotein 1a n=1 Tax=Frankliniella fusca TaxID=407009 RepID=A0AAE1HV13_9NEOP|nr:Replicase polyprotein 1a [Frankliniella fusca]
MARTHLLTPLVASAAAAICILTVCHAAAIPAPDRTTATKDVTVTSSLASSTPSSSSPPVAGAPTLTFLGSGGRPGTPPSSVAAAGDASREEAKVAVVEPGRPGVVPPGREHALDGVHALAHPAHMARQPALDAAAPLLPQPGRDGGGGRVVGVVPDRLALGMEEAAVREGAAKPIPDSGNATDAALLESIILAIQSLGDDGEAFLNETVSDTASGKDQLEPQHTKRVLAQVRVMKRPVYSDSYLPPLIQVVSHLVEQVEEREERAKAEAEATTTEATAFETEAIDVNAVAAAVTTPASMTSTEAAPAQPIVVPVLGGEAVVVPTSSAGTIAILPVPDEDNLTLTPPLVDDGTHVVTIAVDGAPVTSMGSQVEAALPDGQSPVVVPISGLLSGPAPVSAPQSASVSGPEPAPAPAPVQAPAQAPVSSPEAAPAPVSAAESASVSEPVPVQAPVSSPEAAPAPVPTPVQAQAPTRSPSENAPVGSEDKNVQVQLEPLVQTLPELLPPLHIIDKRTNDKANVPEGRRRHREDEDDRENEEHDREDDRTDEKDDREDEKHDRDDDREDEKHDRDDDRVDEKHDRDDDREDEKHDRDDDRVDEKHDRDDDREDEKHDRDDDRVDKKHDRDDDREDEKHDRDDDDKDDDDDDDDDDADEDDDRRSKTLSIDDDDDMMEDMPVVQRDVPIVNEETVPMMMMLNMVPSDKPEMVMDMPVFEFLEAAEDEDEPHRRTKRNTREDIFPSEFKTFLYFPTMIDGPDGNVGAKSAGEEEEDDEVYSKEESDFLDSIGAEANLKKQPAIPASRTLLDLIKLRFALSADAKQQNFKNIQGYAESVVADLARTSALTGREQLGVLLATVIEKKEIRSPRTLRRAQRILDELLDERSDMSRLLDGIPALKYTP